MEKVILYGIGKYCEEMLSTFPGCEKYIDCFIDRYTEKKEFYRLPVYRPDVLTEERFRRYKIVVTLKYEFYEIRDSLMKEYGVQEERIIYVWQWTSTILDDPQVRLRPKAVRLESCTLCQLKCAGCYMRNTDNGTMGKGYLKADDFRNLLDNDPYIREVELSNSGEPFLNPDMEAILRLAHERSVKITFFNGVNFNDISDRVLEALVIYNVYGITFSIDGASQGVYSAYRRNGSLDKVIENIKKLNQLKKAHNSEYPKLHWQFVLMQQNQHEAKLAREMAKKLHMDIYFKLNDVKEEFVPYNRNELSRITGLNFFTKEEWREHNDRDYMTPLICQHMFFSPQINWDGRLLGCGAVFQSDWKVNVFREGLEAGLNCPPYRAAVIGLLGGNSTIDPDSPCGRCRDYKPLQVQTREYVSFEI